MELKKKSGFLILFVVLLCFAGCRPGIDNNVQPTDRLPVLMPDYCNIIIPPNIAPMNFSVLEEGSFYMVSATSHATGYKITVKSTDGIIRFPEKSWKKLLHESIGDSIEFRVISLKSRKENPLEYKKFHMTVAREPIDPYLVYRLIHPGFYSWSKIRIVQRSLESFREESVIENQMLEMNCVNCHSFNQYNKDKFMVHIRGSKGGTYFAENGKITKRDIKIESMPGGATYPSWHPGGKYVAYSSNQVRQNFYSHSSKSIEVFDLVSSLILYDLEKNETVNIIDQDSVKYLQTFPSWSPDGKYLYFCQALQGKTEGTLSMEDIKSTKYNLARKQFDPETRSFGNTEIVFDASAAGKSTSFPRVSPDGKYLVFTLHDYGTFPIWHKEADLYILDLANGNCRKMDLNSNETDSYHSWSSNGKWLVFSSKRTDGRSTRPQFAYFESWDHTGKPFILPQKDPSYYNRMIESFNIPEFVNGRISFDPRNFASASEMETIKAKPGVVSDSLPEWMAIKKNIKRNPGEKSIHE